MSESSTDDEGKVIAGAAVSENAQDSSIGSESSSEEGLPAAPSADSATAGKQDDNKPKSIADAVRAALDQGKEQSSGSGDSEDEKGATDPKAAKEQTGEEEDLGDLTEEELNSYKGKTQRRFKQLDGKNRALSAELEQVKPLADLGFAIKGMADRSNLSREDINTGFNIMDLMRNNPVKAYEALSPIYETLRQIVGAQLPPDLQEQVTAGEINAERAQELSRLRAKSGLDAAYSKEREVRAENHATEEHTRHVQTVADDVGRAVTKWENSWQASDPDYARKQSRVMDAIDLELLKREKTGTLPTNVKEALAICSGVKTKVEAEFKKILPRKNTTIEHVTGNGATNGSKPAATSSRDAIMQSLNP